MARRDLEPLRAELRARGLRATTSRVAVLELVRAQRAPMSHAEVAERLSSGGWDRATLYRNLMDLAEAELLTRSDHGDHVWRFGARDATHAASEHPHFVCSECGTVECLPDVELSLGRSRAPKAVRGKQVVVQLRGVCDACA